MSKPNGRLHVDAPSVVTERTCAYSAYGLPVNHGSVRLIETAGILIGAIVVFTVGSVRTDASSPPGSFASGKVAFTGRQCLPEWASVETFDQTTELSPNALLVASSNS